MADSTNLPGQHSPRTVVVSGDVTMDWNLAREPLAGERAGAPDTRASWQRGGAALLADLVSEIGGRQPSGDEPVVLAAVEAPTAPIPPGDDGLNHSYALWTRFPRTAGDREPGAWRAQALLGVDRARSADPLRAEWRHLAEHLPTADVVLLDDAALGFRDLSEPDLWERTFRDRRPWVVLKQARPVAEGPLWDQLLRLAPDRLVLVLTLDDLRGREVQVSRALSWERTAQDLLWELVHTPRVTPLSHISHTVVSFGAAGAALVSAPGPDRALPTCTLYYDPQTVEGSWSAEHPGQVLGTTDTLTAALVRQILLDPAAPDFGAGIQAGVAAARHLHLEGYEERGPGRMELGFPLSAVVDTMESEPRPLQESAVPDPAVSDRFWTILEDRCTGDLAAKATEIVLDGPERALEGVPLGRFGKLVTADRSEIEAFRSVAGLIGEYVRTPSSKPLSIGVFGPPGAGKSFGVKEVAKSIGREAVDKPLEFNLSQLGGPEDLADAFHLVRDRALAGTIPLVFWDEFDTSLDGQPLGWLRYFLAPMQDGEFRVGQLTHPIGRSIFVFAGGTSSRVEDFAESMHSDYGRLAKGPDFVSRLKGFVNILGPNPQGKSDPYHVVRRAILLRSLLERNAKGLFAHGHLDIDPGVLRALLRTKDYRHGARSLEAIIAMSRLSGKSTYERSSLPPEPQLNLHVDAGDFLSLVQRPDLEGELLDRLSHAAHAIYRQGLQDMLDAKKPLTPEERGSMRAYEDLEAYQKDENVRTVRAIPEKLELVGCVMRPAQPGLRRVDFTDDEVELLARDEHERWLRDLGPGWRHGDPTDKDLKVHVDYLPWPRLDPDEQEKDRNLVRQIPRIVELAGYVVVRTGESRTGRNLASGAVPV